MTTVLDKSTDRQKLMAIVKPEGDRHRFWLLDLTQPEACFVCDKDQLVEAVASHLTVVLDAKQFIQDHAIPIHPSAKWICLSTIKKLLTAPHETIDTPSFTSPAVAHHFIKTTVSRAFEHIEKRRISALAKLECQVITPTIAMERRGLPFNKQAWEEALKQFAHSGEDLSAELQNLLPRKDGFLLFGPNPIDLNNQSAVKESLEKLMGTKLAGTSHSHLKDIDHKAAKLLIRYRENARMLSTYGESFLTKIRANRLHGTFVPIGSISGRFSCHEPNLLALPNHDTFQECLTPPSGYKIIHFDYSAFELRILAALSGESTLVDIFNDDQDIHSMVAETVFKQKVSKTENQHLRNQAKILNFGIIYGMQEASLAAQLGVSLAEAAKLLKNYFVRFSKVKDFLLSLEALAQKQGYVETILGRRAYLHKEGNNAGRLGRVARNMPIQGTGADILKLAMCYVFGRLSAHKLDAHIINAVHDELVIECHENAAETVSEIVQTEMTGAFSALLPSVKPLVSITSDSNSIN